MTASSTMMNIAFETGLYILFLAGLFLPVVLMIMYILWPADDSIKKFK